MVEVFIIDRALDQIANLPLRIQTRVETIVDRLENWPDISGAKPMRGNRKGQFRIRTGDFRVIFTVDGRTLTIIQVGHRKDVYKE